MLLLLLVSLYPVLVYAQQSLILKNPTNVGVNSGFKIRKNPVSGKVRPHKGVDLPIPCGTKVNTGGPIKCNFNSGGWGTYGVVDSGCGVQTLYGHLNGAPQSDACKNGNTYVISGGKTQPWAGGSTGCHLHYEVIMPDGTRVDPTVAWGKNLCDPAVRAMLIKDAQAKLNGQAGGKRQQGGGGGGAAPTTNPTTPPPSPTGQIIEPYVPESDYNPPPPEPYILPAIIPPTTDDVVPKTETDNPVTGCDTAVWNSMVNLSALQTRREMLVNERFIAKGDSVLPYACFEDLYFNAGSVLPILSETRRWENAQIDILGKTVTVNVFMGETSLDGAIVNAVDEAVYSYLVSNFDHELLGGLLTGKLEAHNEGSEDDDEEETPEGEEEGDVHNHRIDQYGYNCGKMREVWNMAKCMNADDISFYKFEDLIGNDPRIYPHNYACNDSGITQGMIDFSKNGGVEFDNIVTYFDFIQPTDKECTDPIPTGVTVTRDVRKEGDRFTKKVSYDDALCITPGCTYQNKKLKGLGECKKSIVPWEID